MVVLSEKHAVKLFEKKFKLCFFLQFVPIVALESWCKVWCRLSKKFFFLVLQMGFLEFALCNAGPQSSNSVSQKNNLQLRLDLSGQKQLLRGVLQKRCS